MTDRPKIVGKNVTITNLTMEQYKKLVGLSQQKNMSISAYMKHLLEQVKFNEDTQEYCSSEEGFWG